MALIVPGSLAGQVSGRIGSVVYSHNRGGPYVRNGTVPTRVTSADALAAKARLAAASQAWQNLTDAQRLAWAAWAQVNPVVNRVGHSITLTGHAAYVALNSRLAQAGQAAITLPPVAEAPAPLSALSATGDIGAGDAELVFTPAPLAAGIALFTRAAVVDSTGITNVQNLLKVVYISAAALATDYAWQSSVEAAFGALAVGQVVHFECQTIRLADGQVSKPLKTSVVVSST